MEFRYQKMKTYSPKAVRILSLEHIRCRVELNFTIRLAQREQCTLMGTQS